MSRASSFVALVAVALSLVLGAPAAGAPTLVPGPTTTTAWIAHVIVATVARAAPSTQAREVAPVETVTEWNHGPVRLLVLQSTIGSDGRLWLRVRLPIRPNTASGWIVADDARIASTPWRIDVDTTTRTLTVLHGGRPLLRVLVVVGKPSTPTPTGLFAIYERVRQPPGSELGGWALHLTAHSNVLFNYGGGPGRVAIHGRAGPLLADPLGSDASHGCIRLDSSAISWVAAHVQPGTPVTVHG